MRERSQPDGAIQSFSLPCEPCGMDGRTGVELLLDAVVEPDVDEGGLGDETHDPDGGGLGPDWMTTGSRTSRRATSSTRRRRPEQAQLSAGTTASQKSSLRPVEPLTRPRSAMNSSSNGSVGVPLWSMRISQRL